MDFRSTLGPDRGDAVSALEPDARAWLEAQGFAVTNETPWIEALTHGSFNGAGGGATDYQRLEFLGDRVLGLSVASWLYRAGDGPEGKLSQRLNALVSGATCARIARNIDLPAHIRLGKQARDDGGADSDKILGDVMEALIGACFIENGFDAAQRMVYRLWTRELEGDVGKAKHPKSALQEWAAGNKRAVPHYEVVERSGPDHAARFTVRVSVRNVGEAEASASSKGEAERLAAKAFLEEYG
jgi:ribonuclease-3